MNKESIPAVPFSIILVMEFCVTIYNTERIADHLINVAKIIRNLQLA